MMIPLKGLQELAAAITKCGCAVLVTPTEINLVEVVSFGTSKYMSKMACYWYLMALAEVYRHMPVPAQQLCRVKMAPPKRAPYPDDIPLGNDPCDDIPSDKTLLHHKRSISDDLD